MDAKVLDDMFCKYERSLMASGGTDNVRDLEAELIKEEDQEDDFDM